MLRKNLWGEVAMRLYFILCAVLFHVMAMPAAAERYALVIGNGAYDELEDLRNTHADAKAYRDAFKSMGFETMFFTDLDLNAALGALDGLIGRVRPGDEVAFVYSGHGWSDGQINYLIPTDAPKQASDRMLKRSSIALRDGRSGVLDELERAGVRLTVAVIDACRDNPFDPAEGTRSASMARGLAPISAPQGTFVIFSAGARQQALDRLPDDPPDERLSVFTRVFLPRLTSGVSLEDAISEAQVETAKLALRFNGHQQHPAYYDQTLGETCLLDNCDKPTQTALVVPDTPEPVAPTFVVDARGGGDYRSIRRAVDAAGSGTRIEVQPGRYTEGADVDKPLTIVGVGDRASIVWEVADDNVIRWTAPGGRIENLTIRQAGGDSFGVDFDGGSAEFVGNDASSQGLAIVAIRNGADPLLRGNTLHDSAEGGVFVYDKAHGIIADNVIEHNTFAGIEVRGGSDPTIRDNTIRDGKGGGIFLQDNSGGLIENNVIERNTYAGIEVKNRSEPTIRGNTVRAGKAGGIFLQENARGLIEDNVIEQNAFAGIEVKTGSAPTIRNNKIRNGKTSGIFLQENARGLIEANVIERNGFSGIEIKTGSAPTIRNNKLLDGAQSGIFVQENGKGLIEGNVIERSGFAGISVDTGGAPTIRDNRINDGKESGIFLQGKAGGLIENNVIARNGLAGIEIKTGAAPTIRNNRILDGKQGGIYLQDNGLGVIEDNIIEGSTYAGVEIRTGSDPTVRGNTIRNGKAGGVFVHDNGRGLIERNVIEGNAYTGVEVTKGGDPTIRDNTITGSGYQAVWVYEGGKATVVNNDLRGNTYGGFRIEATAGRVSRSGNRE